jgi:hypothetical protein
MLARRDGGDMKVIPIKLREGDLDIPVQFGHLTVLEVLGASGRGRAGQTRYRGHRPRYASQVRFSAAS